MPAAERALGVWCFGERAGLLDGRERRRCASPTSDAGVADGRPPLSQSLPLDGCFAPRRPRAFFGGLLPEGEPRELLARRLGVSERNDFSMLAPSAATRPGRSACCRRVRRPGPAGRRRRVARRRRTRAARPTSSRRGRCTPTRTASTASRSPARRTSCPSSSAPTAAIGLTKGRTPSTHILKTPIERLVDTVVNEAFCLAVGRAAGDRRRSTRTPQRVGDREFLLVERYDRARTSGETLRLHQEDFCQALGVPASASTRPRAGRRSPTASRWCATRPRCRRARSSSCSTTSR